MSSSNFLVRLISSIWHGVDGVRKILHLLLLVGLFLIFNSVNFSVLQRRNLIGVLRALGLTRRQLMTMLLVEAGVLGAVAGGLGLILGIALGEHLLELVSRTINDLYFRVSVTSVSIESFSLIKGMLAGIGVLMLPETRGRELEEISGDDEKTER